MTASKLPVPCADAVSVPAERASLEAVRLEDRRLIIDATEEQVAALPLAFGSDSKPFQDYVVHQTLSALGLFKAGADITTGLNAGLAIMSAVAPTNELEAVLAAQMVASNHFAMLSWGRATANDDMAIVQANAAMANKASRTFTMQMEALAKMRRGGEQVVRHVHVNDGGQAVIAGTFNAAKGGGGER